MSVVEILAIFFSFVIGVIFGGMAMFLSRSMLANHQIRIAQRKAAKLLVEARTEAKDILEDNRKEIDKLKSMNEAEYKERRAEIQKQENRLQKESSLEHKLEDASSANAA